MRERCTAVVCGFLFCFFSSGRSSVLNNKLTLRFLSPSLSCHFTSSPSSLCVSARGVSYLFDIQVKAFNHVYDGEDVIGQARTGTGKTFSFAIPLVEKLQKESVAPVRGRAPKVDTGVQIWLIA